MKVLRPLLFTNVTCDLTGQSADLAHWLTNLEQVPDLLEGQHPIRVWEYAMTMRNIYAYTTTIADRHTARDGFTVADIGGHTSNFWKLLRHYLVRADKVYCIDPLYPREGEAEMGQYRIPATVEEVAAASNGYRGTFDILTCVSVIEHVPPDALPAFLEACTALLRPNGLLCLTCDFAPPLDPILIAPEADIYHFHWMRERIFHQDTFITDVLDVCGRLGYNLLGATDLAWKGPQVYDYTMASAALVYQPQTTTSPAAGY